MQLSEDLADVRKGKSEKRKNDLKGTATTTFIKIFSK